MRTEQLIELLYQANGAGLSSAQLTQALSVSSRTIARHVSKAQELGQEHGFVVEGANGRGYRLRVTDEERFAAFLEADGGAIDENALTVRVARYLLYHSNCKLNDLADRFHYSRSSMSRTIKDVSALLEPYGLRLSSKAYTGLMVQGGEISARNCILALGRESGKDDCGPETAHALREHLTRNGYVAGEQCAPRFLQYLNIAAERVRAGHLVETDGLPAPATHEFLARNVRTVKDFLRGQGCCPALLEAPGELVYLGLVLSRLLPDGNQSAKFDESILALARRLVRRAMEHIRTNYQKDFLNDEILWDGLVLHLACGYSGYLLGLRTENPFMEEVKRTYPSSYYDSLELAACISAQTRRNVPAEEIAYLTLYFAAAQERKNSEKHWLTVVLCSNGFGTATLLRTRLKTQYENIHIVSVCSWQQRELISSAVDFYLSTVPVEHTTMNGKPVLTLSPFLNEADKQQLDALLSSLQHRVCLRQLCGPRQFFLVERPGRKKRVLEMLAKQLQLQRLLTAAEVQKLFEREALVSTEIAPGVALPHCMVQGPSFMAMARLKEPVPWGNTNAELVILCGYHEGDSHMKAALENIFSFVQDEGRVAKALRCETYEDLMRCIDQ